MRRSIIFLLFAACLNINCSKSGDTEASPNTSTSDSRCGTYKSGQQLYLGTKGGCYYISSGGNKSYVERSACTCR